MEPRAAITYLLRVAGIGAFLTGIYFGEIKKDLSKMAKSI